MKPSEMKKILAITGEISRLLRYIVGGTEFTLGREVCPMGIEQAGKTIPVLRELLDRYDSLIIESMCIPGDSNNAE